MGQRDGQKQARIGHQTVIVEGHVDAVGVAAWLHPMGAPRFRVVFVLRNHYPRSREHFVIPSPRHHAHPFGGLGRCQFTKILINLMRTCFA
jgi:hypothetical protein